LPYSDLTQMRARMFEIAPHLIRIGSVEECSFQEQALKLAEPANVNVLLKPRLLELGDFWMTNSVTRASKTMAECIRAYQQYKEDPHPANVNVLLKPKLLELGDFWMTNSVTRASKTMAECIRAYQQYKEDPHVEESRFIHM
uniref:DHC_N2 domain-containing protein n=1 Tax=Gongylonema pulchrum TaxID=637853 RepID=A0A183E757_9BILA